LIVSISEDRRPNLMPSNLDLIPGYSGAGRG
jgi:hypothetical protein